jgi:diguanylate cyclase (GGDEF)-like protein
MPAIDINTLFLVLVLVSLSIAVLLLIVGKGMDDSLLIWALAYLAQAAGFLLIFLRGSIPDLVSIWLGNMLISVAYSLFAVGLLNFLHREVPSWVYSAPALLYLFFPFLMDNLEFRILLGGAVNALQMLLVIVLLRRHRMHIAGRGKHILSACFAAGFLLCLSRPVFVLIGVSDIESYDSGGLIQANTFLGINVLSIMIALALVLMAKEQAEAATDSMACADFLTGLPNRRSLYERISLVLTDKKSKQVAALMLLDMDNFKTLNDTRGHNAGDQLLVRVGQRLKACVGEHDTVARLGGDEFVVLLPDLGTSLEQASHAAMAVADKIRAALSEPYELTLDDLQHGEETSVLHRCSASVGVKTFVHGQYRREDVLREADKAMYAAKSRERGSAVLAGPATAAPVGECTAP